MKTDYQRMHDSLTVMYYQSGDLDLASFRELHDQLHLDEARSRGELNQGDYESYSQVLRYIVSELRASGEGLKFHPNASVKGAQALEEQALDTGF